VRTVLAVAGLAMLAYSLLAGVFGERATPTASAQSDMYLSRRIDQVEQRFYGIESRLSRLEMPRPTTVTPPLVSSTNETELEFLRSQVNSLRTRLGEAECALLRLDERTLTAAARAARARVGPRDSDKCRQDLTAPIQLSARP
jgi:hypothetical protein